MIIKVLLATLALVWALSFQPATAVAGYLHPADVVHVKYPCNASDGVIAMTEAYTRSELEGDKALAALTKSGECMRLPSLVPVVLWERLGWWTLSNGLEVEVWEIRLNGKSFWAGYRRNSGSHPTPYKPNEPKANNDGGSVLESVVDTDTNYLWKGDIVEIGSACGNMDIISSLAKSYMQSITKGNEAWDEAIEIGQCHKFRPLRMFVLGDMVGTWMLANDYTVEAWEVIYGDLKLYTIFTEDSGFHSEPQPSDMSHGASQIQLNKQDI